MSDARPTFSPTAAITRRRRSGEQLRSNSAKADAFDGFPRHPIAAKERTVHA
jgi:hypothetical protein